jgi:tetratricopeptide (TPR) repeat protein
VEASESEEGYRSVIKDKEKAESIERDYYHMIKTPEDAKRYIEGRVEEFNKNKDYRLARRIGDVYLENLQDTSNARDWYKKAAEINPHDSILRDRIENCTLREYDAKIQEAQEKDDPGLKELKIKRLKYSIQAFERRAQDRPTDMDVQFELGRCYYQAGPSFLDKSIQCFQQAVKEAKRKADSHMYLGLAFQKKGHHDMADTQFERATKAVIGQEKRMLIMYQRALNQAEASNFAQALELGKLVMENDIGYKNISELVEEWAAKAKA